MLSSRLKGNGAVAGAEKKLDTADGNIQSPELSVDTRDGEGDEMAQFGSKTNNDAYSENYTTANEKGRQTDVELCCTTSIQAIKKLLS